MLALLASKKIRECTRHLNATRASEAMVARFEAPSPKNDAQLPITNAYRGQKKRPKSGAVFLFNEPLLSSLFKLHSHGLLHSGEKLLRGWFCITLSDDLLTLVCSWYAPQFGAS